MNLNHNTCLLRPGERQGGAYLGARTVGGVRGSLYSEPGALCSMPISAPHCPCGLGQVPANLRHPPPPPWGLSSLVFPGDWTACRTLGVWFPRPALTLQHPPPDPRQPWPCIYSHDFSLSGSAEAGSLAHIFINPAAQK